MNQPTTVREVEAAIRTCRERCEAAGVPFHADALAAELCVSHEVLLRRARKNNAVGRRLNAALQECTACVIAGALSADPKAHGLWMFYLRNRAGFVDKGEHAAAEGGNVTFVGEERI